jgi:hypothetical protein
VNFEEDRLTMRMAASIERQPVETVLEADYSITRDSVVFGVVTGYDTRVPAGVRVPAAAVDGEEDLIDQPFTFRFRVDGGTLTIKDLRMPGVNKQGDAGLGLVLGGRFMSGAETQPPNIHPQLPSKTRISSVQPRRMSAPSMSTPGPVSNEPHYIPAPGFPPLVPSGAPVYPPAGVPGNVPAGPPAPSPQSY